MQVKKQQLELDMEPWTSSKLGKEYAKAIYCHPAYLTYMQSTSCKMLGWMKHRLESSFQGEISITLDMQMTSPLWQKAKKEIKSLLMKVKEESESWLKTQHSKNKDHGIWSHHFMANKRGNNGNRDRPFWGAPKSLQMVTAATKLKDVCSLGKKSYDQPRQCIKKQRHYFANKDQSGQNYSFSNSHVWM